MKYEVLTHEAHNSIYIQDCLMRKFFSEYPEYLSIDMPCSVPELNLNVVLFTAVDSNAHSEVVAEGFINSRIPQEFSWLCEAFKKHNPYWKRVKLILVDSDDCDIENLKTIFCTKNVYASFFKSMKAFKTDLSAVNPTLSNMDSKKVLQIFEKLIFASSEAEFSNLHKEMKLASHQIFSFFKRKWLVKKELWALGLSIDSKVFLKSLNLYLITIRRRIKQLISNQELLKHVLEKIHSCVEKLRKDWFLKFTSMLPDPDLKEPILVQYAKDLTPYANKLITEQLDKSDNISIRQIDQTTYSINGNISSKGSCNCKFYTLMGLPCCHLLAVRKFLSLSLYIEGLRPSWASKKYYETFFHMYTIFVTDECDEVKANELSRRFQESVSTYIDLWNEIFDCPEEISQERLEILQNILKGWKNKFKIDVNMCEKQNYSCSTNEELENLTTDNFKELYGISLNDITSVDFTDVSLLSEDNIELL